jgi:hypothetical protein
VVKIPSFTRRQESADVDENRTATDETVVRDRTTDRPADRTDRTDRAERPTLWGRWSDRDRTRVTDPATGRAVPPPAPVAVPTAPAGPNAPTVAERRLAGTDLSDNRPTEHVTDTRPDEPVTDHRPEPTPEVPAGPKPRTSVLATLSLVFSISGAFLVLSGALAGYGIAVGAIGFLMAVSAFAATRKRHVAGKLDAMLGLVIGGAAVVIGVLAFTGTFSWPTTDADWVERLRGWLDSQFVDRF